MKVISALRERHAQPVVMVANGDGHLYRAGCVGSRGRRTPWWPISHVSWVILHARRRQRRQRRQRRPRESRRRDCRSTHRGMSHVTAPCLGNDELGDGPQAHLRPRQGRALLSQESEISQLVEMDKSTEDASKRGESGDHICKNEKEMIGQLWKTLQRMRSVHNSEEEKEKREEYSEAQILGDIAGKYKADISPGPYMQRLLAPQGPRFAKSPADCVSIIEKKIEANRQIIDMSATQLSSKVESSSSELGEVCSLAL